MTIYTDKTILKYLVQFKVLIWDFDGVIVDSNNIRDNAFCYALNDFDKFKVNELLIYHRENGGLSRYAKFDWFFKKFSSSVSEKYREHVLKRFSEYCLSRITDPQILRKEVMDVINFLYKEKKLMYIASASSNEELNFAAKELKIAHFFNDILGSPRNKIESVKQIKDLNNSYPNSDFILVGDAINDLNAASQNNINFLGHNNYSLQEKIRDYWK